MSVAVVTAGAGGIGGAICDRLAEDHGLTVIVADINPETAKQKAADMRELGHQAEAIVLDIGDEESVESCVRHVIDKYGQIDVLVNLAGGMFGGNTGSGFKMFWEYERANWVKEITVNLIGCMSMTYAVLPHMLARKQGNIVNISSGKGLRSAPGQTSYSAAKRGIIGFTYGLALETARLGIRVNSVAPGSTQVPSRMEVETEEQRQRAHNAIPIGRRAEPIDVANAVSFLVSDRASHITGAVIDTSGGVELH